MGCTPRSLLRTIFFLSLAGFLASHATAHDEPSSAATHRTEIIRKRLEWFHNQRAYPLKRIPPGARLKALKELDDLTASERRARVLRPAINGPIPMAGPNPSWTLIGPQPIHVAPGFVGGGSPVASGRVTALVVDPTNPNVVYLGAAQGGVWKTLDGGAMWTPLTDTQASLAVGSIALDPSDPSIVYVGTGEESFSGDSYYGAGILKSTDGGSSWTHIPGPFAGPTAAGSYPAVEPASALWRFIPPTEK